jgi:hypothetical protein
MAEKRGQYQYNDDGTVSQLVHNTNETAETSTIAMDHQATLTNTAVTHTSATVAPATGNVQSTWQPVPEGMTEFVNNLVADAAVGNVYTSVFWSEDGSTNSGRTSQSIPSSNNATEKTSNNWLAVGGSFYKVQIWNADTAPHTCSANIKFRP